MKILRILLVALVIFSLYSCWSSEEEDSGALKKFSWFKASNNTYDSNGAYIPQRSREIVYLEDRNNTGKEKVDYIVDKIKFENDVFKDKAILNRSLDVALEYLDEKKKWKDKDEKDTKKEAEETKKIIEELIEEQLDDSMKEALYEAELEKVEENYEKAIEKFEEAFEKANSDEERAEALVWEAWVYEEMWDDEQAEETYEEALDYDDENVDANIWDAQYDIDDDLLDEAEETLENIDTENVLDEQAIEIEVLKALIMTLRWEYRKSDLILLSAIDNYWEHIDIYMLLIENNYFFSLFFYLNSEGLPLDQTTSIKDSYKTKWLEYFNKAELLDSNRVYSSFYYGASKYLLWDRSEWISIISSWSLLVDEDLSLNNQAKKDTYLDYVDVVEKINTHNTTFNYTPEEFDVIIEEKKWIFEKFYRLIDKYKLEELNINFQN